MKEFATKAVLVSEGDIKTYEITFVDKHGREITVTAEGINMVSALKTVIKQRRADQISKVPTWVWLVVYLAFTSTFAFALIKSASPFTMILAAGLVIFATKLLTDTYFKFTK
jgi:hypothetical protein